MKPAGFAAFALALSVTPTYAAELAGSASGSSALALAAVIAPYSDLSPLDKVTVAPPFGAVHEGRVPHDHVLDRTGLLDNARSVSWIASRDADEHAAVLARLAELLPDGTYAIPNLANVMWAVRA